MKNVNYEQVTNTDIIFLFLNYKKLWLKDFGELFKEFKFLQIKKNSLIN